ncbi:DsbA family protein [Streptomyces sp. P1-3]|uniref:DsbA family protein n=1 Tax=Streptomyces sp. P1-3 TaxID=3421658 RepID=UPI003D35F0C6
MEHTTMPARGTTTRRLAAIGAAIALVVAIFSAVLAINDSGGDDHGKKADGASAPATDSAQQRAYDDLARSTERREPGDPLAIGREDAPVVLIEYADYQCSFCGRFSRETKPELIEKYVESGVLRIEFRNFTIFGEDSERAARASWAAGRQGRFWQFHDELYAKPRKGDALSEEKLTELARRSGVADLDRFHEDMTGGAAKAALKKDQEQGYRLGVQSTPSFLVNGRPLAGAQPTEVFSSVIDEAAAVAKAQGKGSGTGGPGASGKPKDDGKAADGKGKADDGKAAQ